jgi:hypothetical protein
LPDESAVSVLSLAELEIGVLLAATADERSRRLALLEQVREVFDPLPVDESVARAYARLVAAAREAGLNPRVIDTLIGATSRAHGLVLHTRDRNQAALPGVETVLVAVG